MFKLSKIGPLASQIDTAETNPEFDTKLEHSTDEELDKIIRYRSETLCVFPYDDLLHPHSVVILE